MGNEKIIAEVVSAFKSGKRFSRETISRLKEINANAGEEALDDLFMKAGRIALDNLEKQPPLAKIRYI